MLLVSENNLLVYTLQGLGSYLTLTIKLDFLSPKKSIYILFIFTNPE